MGRAGNNVEAPVREMMAEVPDINPLRPIWPARPNEKPVKRRRSAEDERNSERSDEKKHQKENNRESGDGHLDEYV